MAAADWELDALGTILSDVAGEGVVDDAGAEMSAEMFRVAGEMMGGFMADEAAAEDVAVEDARSHDAAFKVMRGGDGEEGGGVSARLLEVAVEDKDAGLMVELV